MIEFGYGVLTGIILSAIAAGLGWYHGSIAARVSK